MTDSIVDSAFYGLASLVEPFALPRFGSRPTYPPLFVVGAPRTGTTIVYQHLLNTFRFGYVCNLADEHAEAPIAYSLLARIRGGYVPTYENRYGETQGAAGASDGWHLFERWFPRYELDRQIDPTIARELPAVVRGIEAVYGGPFLNKNNHNSVRVRRLVELFPDARFIHVSRDQADAALSLARAREENDASPGEPWSCPAPQFRRRDYDSQLEHAAYTIVGIEAHLERVLGQIDERNVHRTSYRDFCEEPDTVVDWVEDSYETEGAGLNVRTDAPEAEFAASAYESSDRDRARAFVDEAVGATRSTTTS